MSLRCARPGCRGVPRPGGDPICRECLRACFVSLADVDRWTFRAWLRGVDPWELGLLPRMVELSGESDPLAARARAMDPLSGLHDRVSVVTYNGLPELVPRGREVLRAFRTLPERTFS